MEINKKLLSDIFKIPSMSGKEDNMARFIKEYLTYIGVSYNVDKMGNIYSFKGAKPFLSAHMDTVQDENDVQLANFTRIVKNSIISGLGVIGGDDKCGIYAILHILTEKEHDINFAFTVEEETGTRGARFLAREKEKELEQCLYGIVLDRRGKSDIICSRNGYGTKDFEQTLETIGERFSYKATSGVLSDADVFCEHMSCANLSSGYYRAHSKHEFVVINHLKGAINFTKAILSEVDYKFKKPDPISRYDHYDYGYWDKKNHRWQSYYDDNYLRDPDVEDYYDSFNSFFKDSRYNKSKKTATKINNDKCAVCYSSDNGVSYVITLGDFYCLDCLASVADEIADLIYAEEPEVL